MMSYTSDTCDQESFNSFIAGLLLTKKTVCNLEFFELMNVFENKYAVCVVGENFDLPLKINDSSMSLIQDYEEYIIFNNTRITVRDYLNNIASDRVKEFFGMLPKNKKLNKVIPLMTNKRYVKEYI